MTALAHNIGLLDRALRICAGMLLVSLASMGAVGSWGYVVGLAALLTGVAGTCPAYGALGIDTCWHAGRP